MQTFRSIKPDFPTRAFAHNSYHLSLWCLILLLFSCQATPPTPVEDLPSAAAGEGLENGAVVITAGHLNLDHDARVVLE